jgi:hypothetical protein
MTARKPTAQPRSSMIFDEVRDLVDHAADGRGIFQLAGAVHLVQAQALQRRGLHGRTAGGRADLLDDDGFSPSCQP